MKTTRRDFLKVAGSLTIGFTLSGGSIAMAHLAPGEIPESLKRNPAINAWLEILANGKVRVFTGKLELGQGVRTAISQVAAEELNMGLADIEVVIADTGRTPNEGYTAGSGSMEQSAMAVRYAAAAAKEKLLSIAAKNTKISRAHLDLYNGNIQTKKGKRLTTISALLAGKQITDRVESPPPLKPKADYKLVGRAIPREDITLMVTGKPVYVQDLRFPGMVHARIVRPPSYAAQLEMLDESHVKEKVPNILKLVRNGDFIAVLAKDEYEAITAREAVRQAAKWKEEPLAVDSEIKLKEYLQRSPAKIHSVETKGTITDTILQHTAIYSKPYLMHGSIGPSCAVALYKDNELHIWSHSQGVFPLREALSAMLGLTENKIRITGVPGAGCYGHNGADDVAADAALIAMAYPGKHVRLQWMREDEHLWEPYGSAMLMHASASLDSSGRIREWKYHLISDDHSSRPGGKAGNLLTARYIKNRFEAPGSGYAGGAYRNSQPYYSIPNLDIQAHIVKGPLRVSALRSLGAYANIFAIESFMDELALAAGKDPFEFRLSHLEDNRAVVVLKHLQKMTSRISTGTDEGFGIAFSRYKNSAAYCAVAAKIFVDREAQKIRVMEMWSTIDAGEVINSDGVINQTEGGLIQAASWTLMEEVKFDGRHVTSGDWSSYPIMRFTDSPDVHVEIIPQPNEEVLGAGEAAQGPAAAAIANAVFHATRKRVRDIPISREKFFGVDT